MRGGSQAVNRGGPVMVPDVATVPLVPESGHRSPSPPMLSGRPRGAPPAPPAGGGCPPAPAVLVGTDRAHAPPDVAARGADPPAPGLRPHRLRDVRRDHRRRGGGPRRRRALRSAAAPPRGRPVRLGAGPAVPRGRSLARAWGAGAPAPP